MEKTLILPQKQQELENRMNALGITEENLVEKFILGSGKGGQKINKTFSCVYLKHIPTGIEVKCQQDRSRALNRFIARRLLCDKIESLIFQKESKIQAEQAKIRKQKKRRSRKTKEKILRDKKIISRKKESRKNPTD
ncbi:MAG: peptide chain release factor-like protein [Candidatus Margulisbacteria bacterium]|nr:peptide chain release factor-like protein [Candidatus Margulisiibacteriota bacterium]